MQFTGTLTTWNDDRGFGFITPDQGGQEVFVHIKAMRLKGLRPQAGQALSFEVEVGPQGKKRAKNVAPFVAQRSRPMRRSGPAQWGMATLFALPAFLVLYLIVSVLWRPPLWWAAAYAGLSLVTLVAYALDKSAATAGRRRTPESTLHGLALAGGWPGALLAQQIFRHKSSKAEFRATFWGTVLMNVGAFVALASPWGRSWLGSL